MYLKSSHAQGNQGENQNDLSSEVDLEVACILILIVH